MKYYIWHWQNLDKNEQVLLFLNRRGYAPALICFKCGWHQTCKRCACNMVLHSTNNELRCHHCNAQHTIPSKCPQCAATDLAAIGHGTQRLEEDLAQIFPTANIVRVDRDSINGKNKLQIVLNEIHAGTTNILKSTQMLAKGHHFPNLSLVAIIDIDSALFSADFRAIERIGQLVTQVAGRTGRGTKPGKVILQTTQPENPILNMLIQHGYHKFIDVLYQERHAAKLPPFSHQVLFRAETKLTSTANEFLSNLRNLIVKQQQPAACLGPIPAPMEKRQGFYRAQLLIQANQRSTLQTILQQVIPQLAQLKSAHRVRWSVDVDPLDMY